MNTRPCPECGADIAYRARTCPCGYGKNGRSHADDYAIAQAATERAALMASIEAVATAQAKRWLEDHNIVAKSVKGAERRAKLRAYIARLREPSRKPSCDWARILKSNYIDGVILNPMQISMASEVMSEVWGRGDCRKISE